MTYPADPEHLALGPGVADEHSYGVCRLCGAQGELGEEGAVEHGVNIAGLCLVCQPCPTCGQSGGDCDLERCHRYGVPAGFAIPEGAT